MSSCLLEPDLRYFYISLLILFEAIIPIYMCTNIKILN